jgi:hypothetical protein
MFKWSSDMKAAHPARFATTATVWTLAAVSLDTTHATAQLVARMVANVNMSKIQTFNHCIEVCSRRRVAHIKPKRATERPGDGRKAPTAERRHLSLRLNTFPVV